MLRWAGDIEARVVRLGGVEGNEPAVALYRRNGFHATGEIAGVMPDGVRRELVMVRPLSDSAH